MVYCFNRSTDDGTTGHQAVHRHTYVNRSTKICGIIYAICAIISLSLDGTIASRLLFYEELDLTSYQSQRKFPCTLRESSLNYICIKFWWKSYTWRIYKNCTRQNIILTFLFIIFYLLLPIFSLFKSSTLLYIKWIFLLKLYIIKNILLKYVE